MYLCMVAFRKKVSFIALADTAFALLMKTFNPFDPLNDIQK